MNWESICAKTVAIVQETGHYIRAERERFSSDMIEEKGLHNYVTHVDKGAEFRLVEALTALLPEAGFIAEENTVDRKNDSLRWIIDPLDGTTNFIHGHPPYAISVGLQCEGRMVAGVILNVPADEMFYAWKNGGAWLNKRPVQVSRITKLADSLLATGFPYAEFHLLDSYIGSMKHFMAHSHGVRRLGSAAVDLAWVACGRYEGFWEYGLNPWDVAAGSILLEEAGGKLSDFSGSDNYLFGKELIASNAFIFNEMKEVVQQYFGN